MKKESVLAALEPICSCALLPLDATLLYKGHGIRSASSQVNSKCFQIPPSRCMYSLATSTSKHHLWLMMLLLGTCTSLGRFILSDIKPWNRAIWGARWDSNPRPRRGWTFILYQLSYLRWVRKLKTSKIITTKLLWRLGVANSKKPLLFSMTEIL